MAYDKILPATTPLHEPFWASVKSHAMALQKCDDCGAFRFIRRRLAVTPLQRQRQQIENRLRAFVLQHCLRRMIQQARPHALHKVSFHRPRLALCQHAARK